MNSQTSSNKITQKNVQAIMKMEQKSHEERTMGEKLADGIAAVVGSWPFLIIQSLFLAAWIVLNVIAWMKHWDPYPFILLNLGLSFQAAYASPIIMMSQNRQARLDERRNHLDLQINLMAEQESTEALRLLRCLCDKMGIEYSKSSESDLEKDVTPEEVVRDIDENISRGGEKQKN